jgi:hypothetical protein
VAIKVPQCETRYSLGPFYAEDIHVYTQQTLRTGLSKRGKHKMIKTTCDVPANNKSTLSAAQDDMIGSSHCVGDVVTIKAIVPSHHRSTVTCISSNNIITHNIN